VVEITGSEGSSGENHGPGGSSDGNRGSSGGDQIGSRGPSGGNQGLGARVAEIMAPEGSNGVLLKITGSNTMI
jgi:hypothetical protein